MIKETPEGGLTLTDPENDKKAIKQLLTELRVKLCIIEIRECKKLVYISIAIGIVAVMLLLILISHIIL